MSVNKETLFTLSSWFISTFFSGLSLKLGFGGCGHDFGRCNGLGGLGGFDGFGGFGGLGGLFI